MSLHRWPLTIVCVWILLSITLELHLVWWSIFLIPIAVIDSTLKLTLLLLSYCFSSFYSLSDFINLIDKSFFLFDSHNSDSFLLLFTSASITNSSVSKFFLLLFSNWLESCLNIIHHHWLRQYLGGSFSKTS